VEPAVLLTAERAMERGDADRTIELLRGEVDTLRYDHHVARAASVLCRAYHEKGESRLALDACNKAIDTRAANWSDFNNRGVAHYRLGNYAAAIADFRQAERMGPRDPDVRANIVSARRAATSAANATPSGPAFAVAD
jgi:Flp pilus assembly protein TadD